MEIARFNHSSTANGNKIVVAGYDGEFPIELLDLDEERLKWVKIASPELGKRYNPLIATINKTTVLIGGGLDTEHKKDFFKFNVKK